MAAETQYTARTGMTILVSANSYLDGTTGTYYDVLTAGANGTLIKKVFLKSQGDTAVGMIRFFVYESTGPTTKLVKEIDVPAITKSTRNKTFETVINLNYFLKSGCKLIATTDNNTYINIVAEGIDWAYYGSIRPESTKYIANTGFNEISTADAGDYNGKGATVNIIQATPSSSNGTMIQSIIIKSIKSGTTTPGMIRLYLYAGSGDTILFKEVFVPAIAQSGTAHSFSYRLDFKGEGLILNAGWYLKASTEKGETFNVVAEGLDWTYPA